MRSSSNALYQLDRLRDSVKEVLSDIKILYSGPDPSSGAMVSLLLMVAISHVNTSSIITPTTAPLIDWRISEESCVSQVCSVIPAIVSL